MRRNRTIRVLGIETSCDETAAAVVDVASASSEQFAFRVRSNVVASQVAIHAKYGGIVPEVAAREHVAVIIPVIAAAMTESHNQTATSRKRNDTDGLQLSSMIDAIAVTAGPGLMTSLMVGAETARTLAYAQEKPLIAVNHIEGHVLSSVLQSGRNRKVQSAELKFPALALIVSGGHTELLFMKDWGQYECIGATRDDAAGEAFDKVAKLLGLPYPGGPAVARAAEQGDPAAFEFPRGMIHSGDLDFSFSGLKTAVRYLLEKNNESRIRNKGFVRDVCASFQAAAIDVLVAKTITAAQRYGAQTVLLGGGVAANVQLRLQLGDAVRTQLPDSLFLIPDSSFTGDNAAMIAAAGGLRLLLGESTPWQKLDVNANWELGR
ncbi:MAG: tRNA (adenosine(37)-N6)-threonylcarbamoyltransferase complex transferase subunit TsaD [bacterium]|nr:tRNA (adenosine(37)-N6)-threonylcarbamoyltransferase complex transferase subunit TsaD [bacterium]